MIARDRSYILGDERAVLHRKCTQMHRNFIALFTRRSKQSLEMFLLFPRFEGGGGGIAR
jgi:hypothetical protein